jgi:hypothetical protein
VLYDNRLAEDYNPSSNSEKEAQFCAKAFTAASDGGEANRNRL